MIFLYGIHRGMLFMGGVVAMVWCLAAFYLTRVKAHKVNFFAIFAVIMIAARIVVVISKENLRMYLYVLALDNFVVGAAFAVSLLFKRSLMELFADSASSIFPRRSFAHPVFFHSGVT